MNILEKHPITGEYIPIHLLISALIAESGLSKNEVCKRAGIGRNTLANWEKGDSLRTIELLRRLAKVCEAEKPCEAMEAFEGTAKEKVMYIIIGKPASGKSKLAKELAKKHRNCLIVDELSTTAGLKMYIKDNRPNGIILEVHKTDFIKAEKLLKIAMSAGYRIQYCYTSKTDKGFNVEYNPPLPC